jgi:hypothetical protein
MSDHNNIYNIMGKLNALTPVEQPKQETKAIYESVEARGSVLEGVKKVQANLQQKYDQDMAKAPDDFRSMVHNPNPDKYGKVKFDKTSTKSAYLNKLKGVAEGHDTAEDYQAKAQWLQHTHHMRPDEAMERAYYDTDPGTWEGSPWEDDYQQGVAENRETQKTKTGTIYKGGKYGTSHDAGEEDSPKKKKEKSNSGSGAKSSMPKGDIFGRTTGSVPKGEKGTSVKGAGTSDKTRNKQADDAFDRDEKTLKEKAVSTAQQKFMGMVHATQKGGKAPSNAVAKAASGMTKKAATDYASTKHKGLPAHVKESKIAFAKALLEHANFNLKKMMQEADMTADEMLECISQDIDAYKDTGDMSPRLHAFMEVHKHIKGLEEASKPDAFAPHYTSPEELSPTKKPGIVQRAVNALKGPSDDELLANLEQDVQPKHELDELARLAGLPVKENPNDVLDPADPKDAVLDPSMMEPGDSDLGDEVDEDGIDGKLSQDGTMMKFGEDETGPVQMYQESTSLEDIARLSGIFQEGKDYGDASFNEPPVYDNTPDEQIQGEEVLLHGGDGEVAGQEKKMNKDGAARFSDNPLAMKEDKELLKPAAEFNYVEEMGRDLMKAYQGIKTK